MRKTDFIKQNRKALEKALNFDAYNYYLNGKKEVVCVSSDFVTYVSYNSKTKEVEADSYCHNAYVDTSGWEDVEKVQQLPLWFLDYALHNAQ